MFSNVNAVTYQTAIQNARCGAAENPEKWVKRSEFGATGDSGKGFGNDIALVIISAGKLTASGKRLISMNRDNFIRRIAAVILAGTRFATRDSRRTVEDF